MIRKCTANDQAKILAVINDAAMAYKGVIPEECWQSPYMSEENFKKDAEAGVEFYGYEENGELVGVMGHQEFVDVTLIRHAYVKTEHRNKGIGSTLIKYLLSLTLKPVLVGTWRAAHWSVIFYEKHGFKLLEPESAEDLLKKYWSISERQRETSVVLAGQKWYENIAK